ncbi:hypothetical protein Purlil1_1753 [Purpureocillium lilacinum]|uniref:Cyclic nucleotide-binding domain-containing protein n=1 Tax=Purpureocillium lilacinum TaxID=33203 RepID=A0ABR0CDG8_PURLI|nr:hypothetical protein Purlil1_1753 [Purpureocillium lilacinum]
MKAVRQRASVAAVLSRIEACHLAHARLFQGEPEEGGPGLVTRGTHTLAYVETGIVRIITATGELKRMRRVTSNSDERLSKLLDGALNQSIGTCRVAPAEDCWLRVWSGSRFDAAEPPPPPSWARCWAAWTPNLPPGRHGPL